MEADQLPGAAVEEGFPVSAACGKSETKPQPRGLSDHGPAPKRMPFGPFRGVPLWRIPSGHLELVAALLPPGRVRCALENELAVREGADGTSVPRAEDRTP